MWKKTTMGFRYIPQWVVIALWLCYIINGVNADCKVHPTFIACHRTIPTLENLINAGPSAHVMITEFNGELYTNILEGYSNFTMKSLQIARSRITGIQPRFFARISNGKLGHLTLTSVNGSLYLDSETLGGLEDVLHTLYVSDPVIYDVSYLAKMSRLDSVSLIRTGLSELPNNFVSLLRRVVKLDLSSNKLTKMPWNEVAKRISDVTFSDLKLTQNRWHCDCSLQPVVEAPLEAKRKITQFKCATPQDVADLPLQALTVGSICPEGIIPSEHKRPVIYDSGNKEPATNDDTAGSQNVDSGSNAGSNQQMVDKAQGEDMSLATAGGMSTEVIVVIIAVVAVVAIVLIAVIVFKVRSRDRSRRKHDGDKQPTHKSSAYCSVIEHPNTKPTGKNSGAQNSGGTAPASNSYNRDMEDSERQPLAPPYYSRDPRL